MQVKSITFIKLLFVFKTFVLSIIEWPLKTGSTAVDAIRNGSIFKYLCIVHSTKEKSLFLLDDPHICPLFLVDPQSCPLLLDDPRSSPLL